MRYNNYCLTLGFRSPPATANTLPSTNDNFRMQELSLSAINISSEPIANPKESFVSVV